MENKYNSTEDRVLIKDIKKYSCDECIECLRDKHIGLIFDIYGRYGSVLQSLHFNKEEFSDEINYLVYTSAKKFDLRRKNIKFSTFLGDQTRYFCLNKITELNKKKSVSAEPEDIIRLMDECFKDSNEHNKKQKELCSYVYSLLEQIKDKRVMEIFNLRFFSEKNKMTWAEIGERLGITSQTVINIFNKNVRFIKNKLNSLKEQDRI